MNRRLNDGSKLDYGVLESQLAARDRTGWERVVRRGRAEEELYMRLEKGDEYEAD